MSIDRSAMLTGVLRRAGLAVALVGVLAASQALAAAPARASHQFILFADSGDSQATFGPNQAIVIDGAVEYISDCGGSGVDDGFFAIADVYVVAPGIGVGGGLADLTGSANTVIGSIGGAFVSQLLGFTQPNGSLGAGVYDVVYDECQDGVYDAVDAVFAGAITVDMGVDAPQLPAATIAGIKARALAAQANWEAAHLAYEWLFKLASELSGDKTAIADKVNEVFADVFGALFNVGDVYESALVAIAAVATHHAAIAADPPDPGFRAVATLGERTTVGRSIDPVVSAGLALGREAGAEAALAEALLRSLERYQGADVAGDGEWALYQARAIEAYATLLADQMPSSGAAYAAAAGAVAASTRDYDAETASWEAFRSGVAATGLSDADVRDLRHLGLAAGQVEAFEAAVVGLSFPGMSEASVAAQLGAAAGETAGYRTALQQLAGDAAVIAATLQANPLVVDRSPAARAGGPYAAVEGTPVLLDGSASTSPTAIVSYAWDLDEDGAFDDATGPTPAFTPTASGNGLVGLLVTNTAGMRGVAYAPIDVSPANEPPAIVGSTPDARVLAVEIGGSAALAVTTGDPDGDPVAVSWQVDGLPAAAGLDFSFLAAPADVGLHDVRAIASDGQPYGGSDVRQWIVGVLGVDADGDLWRVPVDCDDANGAVSPGSAEVLFNGLDDDCDAATPDNGTSPIAAFEPRPANGGRNVALADGGASIVSATGGSASSPASALLDLSASTRWQATLGSGQSAVIDLAGDISRIDRISVDPGPPGAARVRDFEVWASVTTTAPAAFTRILSGTAADPATGDALTDFVLHAPADARYLEYRALTNRGSSAVYTSRLKAWTGAEGGPTVTFADVSTDADGDIVERRWDFGDGSAEAVYAAATNPTHTFPGTGTYAVRLTLTDAGGGTSTATRMQVVGAPPSGTFAVDPAAPTEADSIGFTPTGVAVETGQALAGFDWRFGDGTTAQTTPVLPSRSHRYADQGTYAASLDVVDGREFRTTITRPIDVTNAPPTIAFPSSAAAGIVQGGVLELQPIVGDPGSADTTRCTADFGDGSPAHGPVDCNATYFTFTHAWAAPGSYTVTATVTDDDGASASASHVVTVFAAPTLTTGPGDGGLSVQVGAFGDFGYRTWGQAVGGTGDARYDPVGSMGPGSTTWNSLLQLRRTGGYRGFLSTGVVDASGSIPGRLPDPGVATATPSSASSSFTVDGLLFDLEQSVASTFTDATRTGSLLTQTYRITNVGPSAADFELIRYFEGDLRLTSNTIPDGGGRLVRDGVEVLFQTDRAGDPATAVDFVGITAEGGDTTGPGRFEVDQWSAFPRRIRDGAALDDGVFRDGSDADQFVDPGLSYDLGLALSNRFTLAPGAATTYVTRTIFGSGRPDQAVVTPTPAARPPALDPIGDRVIDEGSTLSFTATATDPDVPAAPLAFSLDGAPAGAVIDPATGAFAWTPGEADGPGSFTVDVVVSDGALTDRETIHVTVAEVDAAPALAAIAGITTPWGSPVTFTATAGDPDLPVETLTFSLAGAPQGAAIDAVTGLLTWTPQADQVGSHTFTVRVADAAPALVDETDVTIVVERRPVTLALGAPTSGQYSDPSGLSATLADAATGAPIPGMPIAFALDGVAGAGTTGPDGRAALAPDVLLDQAPATVPVAAGFAGSAAYLPVDATGSYEVRPEDARATYGGALFVATGSVSSGLAPVTLSAAVRDISAVAGDPAADGSPGDIRRATVTFVDRGSGGLPLCQASVALVSPGDLTTGTATCTWNADIGSADSLTFRVGIVVGGSYVRDAATEDTTVTISRPVATMFITGGGYVVNEGSAGLFPGDPGARTNVGFNVRYNRSATNLKGHVTVIVRSGGRTYQVRGNALTSLATQACRSGPASAACPSSATLLSKANVQDVSDPAIPVSLDGNATVQLTVTDRGEPGSADSIAIVVRDKDGRMWSASAWSGSAAVERPLAGGNLVAH